MTDRIAREVGRRVREIGGLRDVSSRAAVCSGEEESEICEAKYRMKIDWK
jgi:hypothetical protein